MSWSMQVELKHEHTEAGLQKDLEALNAGAPTGNGQCIQERNEQIEAAKRAVLALLVEGDFSNAEEIYVSLAGHANKNHAKDPQWANEYISININIKKYRDE